MYNRHTPSDSHTSPSRRRFLKLVLGTGAGLTLGVHLPSASASASKDGAQAAKGDLNPNAFVRIDPQGKVYVMIKHLEMGQGSYTGLAALVAEELDAHWDDVVPEGAPANAKKYQNLHWGGAQGTGGSSGMANSFEQMRVAGATAKMMLVTAAARKWSVKADTLSVKNSVVRHAASGREATFGELAELAANEAIPALETVRLKDPKDFQYIGRSLSRKDTGKNNGTAVFTQDIKLDGMLTAVVAHPPLFGATLTSFDDTAAKKVKGVVDVVAIPSGVAVLATDFWSAKKGRDALTIQWDDSKAFKGNSDDLVQQFKQLAKTTGAIARQDGDAEAVLAKADKIIEVDFEFPYLAHATMEPMNCVAIVNEDGCEIWNGEQVQTLDQGLIAQALGMTPEQVNIHMVLAGGSFGRRANPLSDYLLETVHIAKAHKGIPIKLVWTREDDTQGGYYRPLYVHKIRGALDKQGHIVAWHQRIVGQSIVTGTPFEFLVKDGVDSTSLEGASTLPYQIDNLGVELHTVALPVTVQWWRSVGHTHTAYSTEVFFDLMARAAGKDPVEMRMALLSKHPRHQGVLKLAAEKAGWGKALPKGHAMGVAVHESFNSYVAQVAEVSQASDGSFKVERVVCAVDCGIAVNPDIVKAQMEGGIGYGLSPALMSEITLENGKVVQSNFHDYQVLRIHQMPEIEVHIVPSAKPPTGVGEPGTPPIAPAVANALYALTGQTLSKLPIKLTTT